MYLYSLGSYNQCCGFSGSLLGHEELFAPAEFERLVQAAAREAFRRGVARNVAAGYPTEPTVEDGEVLPPLCLSVTWAEVQEDVAEALCCRYGFCRLEPQVAFAAHESFMPLWDAAEGDTPASERLRHALLPLRTELSGAAGMAAERPACATSG